MSDIVVSETTESALSLALSHPSWNETVDSVKMVVIRQLRGLGSGAELRSTPFFNHTFAPDITMTWPSSREERKVYLRFPDDVDYISANIAQDLPSGSLVFGLGDLGQRSEAPSLAAASSEHDTLVLDPRGSDALQVKADMHHSGLPVVTAAIARGGRGFFHERKASSVTRKLIAGWRAAAQALPGPTEEAAQVTRADFMPSESAPLEQLLQTFWVAGGGSAADYPGDFHARVRIGADELRLILSTAEIDDWAFWRHLGDGITLSEIVGAGEPRLPSNLDRLVRANVDRLEAKVAWIKAEERLTEPGQAEHEWQLVAGLLSLRAPAFSAYFAPKKERFRGLISANRRKGISAVELLDRADGLGIKEITQSDGRRRLVFSTDDITRDTATAQIAESIGPDARVVRAQATVAGGTHVTVDFEESTVTAVTSSTPSLREIAQVSAQALVPADHRALETFLHLPEEVMPEAASFGLDWD